MTQSFDAVIAGAGPAGCVLANRLTEDESCRVLLLEAGPDYGSDPASWPPELLNPNSVVLDSHLGIRQFQRSCRSYLGTDDRVIVENGRT